MGHRRVIKGINAIDYEKRLHAVEVRYETQLRALEEKQTRLATDLQIRFRELGTLTRMMQEKDVAAAEDLANCRAQAAAREAELGAHTAQLEQHLSSLLNSTSWRITRPLRWIIRRLRAE